MKVLWLDPVNTDAQFLNALALAMSEEGVEVIVRSNKRFNFPPPDNIKWSSFTAMKFPQSLEGKRLFRLAIAIAYPLNWLRAVRFAKKHKVKSVLISTNLAIPSIDTWGMRLLRRADITPVVIVHKPYHRFFNDPTRLQSPRYKSFYEEASKILVMTDYAKHLLQEMYSISNEKFVKFEHLHFTNLLSNTPVSIVLRDNLKKWEGYPVVSFISNMHPERGVDTFLSCLKILKKILPDIRVIFLSKLSDVHARQKIEQRTKDAGLYSQCVFHWEPYSYSELLTYLSVTSVVAVPYNTATQSGVIALAAGYGIPAVATSVGGLPEMIIPGKTGEIVSPNDPATLAQAIAKVVQSQSYKENITKYADLYFSPQRAARIVAKCVEGSTKRE